MAFMKQVAAGTWQGVVLQLEVRAKISSLWPWIPVMYHKHYTGPLALLHGEHLQEIITFNMLIQWSVNVCWQLAQEWSTGTAT